MLLPGSTYITIDSLAETVTLAKSGRCVVTLMHAINTTGAAAYIQLFDAAAITEVTLGTTLPVFVLKSAANDPATHDGIPAGGVVFTRGVCAASTTAVLGSTGAAQHVRLGIV